MIVRGICLVRVGVDKFLFLAYVVAMTLWAVIIGALAFGVI